MKALAITHKGAEDVCRDEIKEILGKDSEIVESACIFEADEISISRFTYMSQSSIRVMQLLKSMEFKDTEDMVQAAKEIPFKDHISGKFKVECIRQGKHVFNSHEVAADVGAVIEGEVSMDNPDTIVMIFIQDDRAHIGIDYAGLDLSKRDYKIFTSRHDIKGTLAYATLKLAGMTKGSKVLDPICATGTIAIEAAHYLLGRSVNFFRKNKLIFTKMNFWEEKNFEDWDRQGEKIDVIGYDPVLRNVKSSQKNAKIADINKEVTFSKIDLDWLDIKIEKHSFDLIATNPPGFYKHIDHKQIEKKYEELFFQADYVLRKGSKLAILTLTPERITEVAKRKGYASDVRTLQTGKMEMAVIITQKEEKYK